jgi:signal transduction histidine kinase
LDTKLKNNKKTINRKFLIISLCIAIMPILLGLSNGLINNNAALHNKLAIYDKYVVNLRNSITYNDENGNIREDAIAKEINSIKYNYKCDLKVAQQNLESYSKELGINSDQELKINDNKNISSDDYETYTGLKDDFNVAKDNLNKSQETYREEAIENIKQNLIESTVVNNQINIEYYIEYQDGQIISNISEISKSEIIDKTKSESNDYMMFLDIVNNSPKEIDVTRNLNWKFDDLIHNRNLDTTLTDLKNVIIRIPNPLKKGDELYSVVQKDNIANTIGYGSLLLFALDICLISILGLRFVKEKRVAFKETIALKLYTKLFIEIRLLAIVLMLTLLLGLHHLIDDWGSCLIQDYITSIVDNTYLPHVLTFYNQLFIEFIVTIIIGYLLMCDIYQLYFNKNINELKQYAHDKSMFRIIYNRFEISVSNKSMTKRMAIFLFIFVLYLALIVCSTLLLATHESFLFYMWNMSWYYSTPRIIFIGSIIISILGTALVIKYIIAFFNDINKIKTATDNIIKGTYKNEIKIKNSSILKELANNIMNIDDGLDKAIYKAVKSERMKGELITNVSHDLKTPLTSIINYVDLLDKENISEEKKKDYLDILKERSARLKVLIEDLFEASKAASGNLEMHMEDLDPVALLRQTLGEFEDKINISKLEFIKKLPQEKLTIYADGKKTFRIFQNLISNILKYSLNGTRVYIDVEEKERFVSMTFKNISAYPLNFTEEEILERFKRGDASRTTEGSGLGLSIAKSLVELQGGIFEIKLDGDLFKVVVLLKKAEILI